MKRECLFIPLEVNLKNQNRISLMGFMITLILSLILCSNAFAQDADNKLEKIKTQIHILNLLNGLELNNQQMQLILGAAKEAKEIRLKAKEAISQKEEITQAYQDVLRVAKSGSLVIPQDIAFRVHKVNQEVDKIKKVAQGQLTAFTLKIKNSLKPHQIYVLDDYKPCIIPPVKKGKIGQVGDASGFVKVLEHIQAMPKEQYHLRRDKIAQEAIDKVKTKVPPGYILEEEKIKSQLLKAMDDVRGMSDMDFTIKKEKIAEAIKTQLLPKKPPVNIGVKIERFFLQPEIIPLLEERIKSG
jgi:hypothetical protein